MKIIASLLFLFASHSAFADLSCEAVEKIDGVDGRAGAVVVGQYPFSFTWAGEQLEMTGRNTLCGVVLNRSTLCQTVDTSSASTIASRMMCADSAVNPLENRIGEGYFVYSLASNAGRFVCSYERGQDKFKKVIEVKNCR